MPAIQSRLGLLFYLLRRNDKSWNGLSDVDRALVLKANFQHNNYRPDYANPEKYRQGLGFDSVQNRTETWEGKKLHQMLTALRPVKVVEVGPGSGFLTQMLVYFDSVRDYIGIDIVRPFLDFIEVKLQKVKAERAGFGYELIDGDFEQILIRDADAVIMISTLHHIPNRLDVLRWVDRNLKMGGRFFCYEPAHYLPRIWGLLAKFVRRYHRKDYRSITENYSTHHFCTIEEFEVLLKMIPGLKIRSFSLTNINLPHFARKIGNRLLNLLGTQKDEKGNFIVENKKSWLRFFSTQLTIELEKVA